MCVRARTRALARASVCVLVNICEDSWFVGVYLSACVCMHVRVQMFVCMPVCINVCVCVYARMLLCVLMCVCVYVGNRV